MRLNGFGLNLGMGFALNRMVRTLALLDGNIETVLARLVLLPLFGRHCG